MYVNKESKSLISFQSFFLSVPLQIETEHDFGYSFPQLKIDEEKRQYLHSQVVDSPFIDNKQQETFQKTFEALYTERQPQEKQV